MLSFLLARDTMHQNQWLAAIEELQVDRLEETPCPSHFPQEAEAREFSYQFLNFSDSIESAEGRWARGVTPDGKGEFEYIDEPVAHGEEPAFDHEADPLFYGTAPNPER